MCGLIGYFTPTWGDVDKNAVIDLMLISQVRGLDSTGVVLLTQSTNNKNLYWESDKEAVPAGQYIYNRKYGMFYPTKGNRYIYGFMAHVRAATKGEVSDKNAHPFSNKKVVGMHNGTVHGYFENSSKFDTDSEAILQNIAEFGIEEGLKKVNTANKVAYALQFYNHETGDIHFIRNDERPLYMAWEKSSDTYVTASEKVFLKYIEEKYKFKFDRLIQLQENHLYTLKKTTASLFHFSDKKLDVKPPPKVYTSYPPYSSNYHQNWQARTTAPVANSARWQPPGIKYTSGFKEAKDVQWPTVEALAKVAEDRIWVPPFRTSPQLPLETPSDGGEKADQDRKDYKDCKVSVVDQITEQLEKEEVEGKVEVAHAPYSSLDRFSWNGHVECGCMYCSSVPDYSTRGRIKWFNDQDFLCAICAHDPAIVVTFPELGSVSINRVH